MKLSLNRFTIIKYLIFKFGLFLIHSSKEYFEFLEGRNVSIWRSGLT
jgi:hypothetical protein